MRPICGKRSSLRASESKLHRAEKRELRAACVDIFETLPRLQRRSTAGKHDVLGKRRSVFDAKACIFPDRVTDGRLKQQKLQRFRPSESQIIEIGEAFQFRSNFEVRA